MADCDCASDCVSCVRAFFSYVGVIAYVGVILFTIIYRAFVYKRIGGMNGDTLGAGGQMGQLICLFCLVLLWGLV